MGQKVNIIRCLEMMGYTVTENNGIIGVKFTTKNSYVVSYYVGEYEILYGNFIVEHIVATINKHIVDNF